MTHGTAVVCGTGRTTRAIAEMFASRGAPVAIVAEDEGEAEPIVSACTPYGVARWYRSAFDDESDLGGTLTDVHDQLGPIRSVVLVAEQGPSAALDRVALDIWERALHRGLTKIFLMAKHSIGLLEAAGEGTFTAVLPLCGSRGVVADAAHTAAFHGVIGLVRSMALDFGSRGVRSNAVIHGVLANPMEGTPEIPAGRVGTPEEVAQLVLHLSSPAASYTNGTVQYVDGAMSAGYFEREDE